MPQPKKLRGDIAEALNPMVRDGTITGFSTNLYFEVPPDEIVVRVVAPCPTLLAEVRGKVETALRAVSAGIVVSVMPPEGPEDQQQGVR